MKSSIKKALLTVCLSMAITPHMYALTAREAGAKVASQVWAAVTWLAKMGAAYMPEGYMGRATVGGLGIGSVALRLKCHKIAIPALAIGSAATYFNYRYHQERKIVGYKAFQAPGGVIIEGSEPIYESFFAWLKRTYWTTEKVNDKGVTVAQVNLP